ncbi:hypothetical protein AVEN_120049-1 [Araneus ventricosus]|uniref:p53 transactivation domain-containing protein n=1 Tax=Araneus ventricosus TaxID=182803 RepID=A0A4Y2MFJ3_ARAVE|nr:hypothetical protein AVEN_120049-1 [Araneus ventricosus]
MGDENAASIASSQESLPLSQDTFEYLWNELVVLNGASLAVLPSDPPVMLPINLEICCKELDLMLVESINVLLAGQTFVYHALLAVDRLLQALKKKAQWLGGDFRQVLPVTLRGSWIIMNDVYKM